jgi:hypothetical protein
MILVSSLTALGLAFWLINKFQKNKNLRPEMLYKFIRLLVYVGGAVTAFFGFIYIVYSWLYGNLPVAVLLKAVVAIVIIGTVAMYFYLTSKEGRTEALLSRVFAILLVIATVVTLYLCFQIVGTPAEARMYRLDSITLQNLQTVKQEIDNQDQNFGNKISNLSEINSEYVRPAIRQTEIVYSTASTTYTLCAKFNQNMPETINDPFRNSDWDYHAGESCFTFPHLPTYLNANAQPKPVIIR